MKKFLIGLILTIVGIASLILIPSKQVSAPMPWETVLMSDGQISVFNIHLGTTTYRQAQTALGIYGETSIFSQAGEESTVEAFFNSINMGGLSAKAVLNLAVNKKEIEVMQSRATEARLQPSGAHRYQLNNQDKTTLTDAPVIAITYIPSVKLNKEMVLHRFGPTEFELQDPDNSNTTIFHYPESGIKIFVNPNEKTIIQYKTTY